MSRKTECFPPILAHKSPLFSLQVKENFPKSRILVCAQCNSACDYIAIKLMESGRCDKENIIRLNSSSRTEDVPREIESISSTVG